MNIQYDRKREFHTHERSVSFEDAAPELYIGYTHKDKQWVPSLAMARWQHGEPIEQITLYGRILKKDGSVSANRGEIRYVTPAHKGWGRGYDPQAPYWLLALFADSKHTTPEGA